MNFDKTREICDQALANYNFGEGVFVEATSGWESNSNSKEVSCPIFLKFEDDEPEQDTHRATFTVIIENCKATQAECSYKGNLIGNYDLI